METKTLSIVNPERIKYLADSLNLDLTVLSDALKLNVEKLRKGNLTFNQLEKVADYFGHSWMFFCEQIPANESIQPTAFRSLSNQGVQFDNKLYRVIKNCERLRDIYIELSEELDEYEAFLPPSNDLNFDQFAGKIRSWLKLDSSKTYSFDDYRELIEQKGILVFRVSGYKGQWKIQQPELAGFCVYHHRTPVILIKKTNNNRDAFTLFHELAHLLLHHSSYIDTYGNFQQTTKQYEQEANKLAGLCLVNQSNLSKITTPVSLKDCDQNLIPLSRRLGISVEVILRRLLDQKLVSNTLYNQYRKYKQEQSGADSTNNKKIGGNRKYRHREPKHLFGKHYVGTVLQSLNDNNITLNKASDYLDNLKICDVHKLENHFADLHS